MLVAQESNRTEAPEGKLLAPLGHPQQIRVLKRRATEPHACIGDGSDLQGRCLQKAGGRHQQSYEVEARVPRGALGKPVM